VQEGASTSQGDLAAKRVHPAGARMYQMLKTTREPLQMCQKTLEHVNINRRSQTHLMDSQHVAEHASRSSGEDEPTVLFRGTESRCNGMRKQRQEQDEG